MLMRALGRTGMKVAALCLGGNTFGWTTDQKASEAVLDAYVEAGVWEVGEPDAVDGGRAGRRGGQTHHDAHRGGLAGSVRTEETGDAAGQGGEGDVVDGGEAGVRPGQ